MVQKTSTLGLTHLSNISNSSAPLAVVLARVGAASGVARVAVEVFRYREMVVLRNLFFHACSDILGPKKWFTHFESWLHVCRANHLMTVDPLIPHFPSLSCSSSTVCSLSSRPDVRADIITETQAELFRKLSTAIADRQKASQDSGQAARQVKDIICELESGMTKAALRVHAFTMLVLGDNSPVKADNDSVLLQQWHNQFKRQCVPGAPLILLRKSCQLKKSNEMSNQPGSMATQLLFLGLPDSFQATLDEGKNEVTDGREGGRLQPISCLHYEKCARLFALAMSKRKQASSMTTGRNKREEKIKKKNKAKGNDMRGNNGVILPPAPCVCCRQMESDGQVHDKVAVVRWLHPANSSSSVSLVNASPSSFYCFSAAEGQLELLFCPTCTEAFHLSLFLVLSRYHALQGCHPANGAMQAAIHTQVFDSLQANFDVDFECCASPLNCRYPSFCSAFPDVDAAFGSMGSIFNFFPRTGGYEVNPPFDELFIARLHAHIHTLLTRSEATSEVSAAGSTRQTDVLPLTFVVVFPFWRGRPCWQMFLDDSFTSTHLRLPASEHGYVTGSQQSHVSRHKMSSSDTSIFIMQNSAAKAIRPVTSSVETLVRQAFASKHSSA